MHRTLFTRSITLAALSALGFAFTLVVPGAAPPSSAAPSAIAEWWDDIGTASAAMAILRIASLVAFAYVGLISITGAVIGAARRGAAAPRLPRFVLPALRRHLAGGAIVVSSIAPTAAAAQETSPFVLTDVGPTPASESSDGHGTLEPAWFVAVDLRAATVPPAAGATEASVAASDVGTRPFSESTWVVAPGDHLWTIAEETLIDHGRQPSTREVSRYWRRVIDANRTVVGSDPDLIHPGQQIRLPAP